MRHKPKSKRGNPKQSKCSRKIGYPTSKEAAVAVRSMKERGEIGLSVYRCQFCKKYHVGHKDKKDRNR